MPPLPATPLRRNLQAPALRILRGTLRSPENSLKTPSLIRQSIGFAAPAALKAFLCIVLSCGLCLWAWPAPHPIISRKASTRTLSCSVSVLE